MATPIEIAGLTLAVFPIVINGLTQMREGAETVRYWRRYRVKLKEYACELDSARVYYLDTLEELLVGIVDSKDEMSKLMEDPGGAAWRQPKYDARLRQRLDRSYGSYMQILEKMRDASLDLRSKLGLDASGKILLEDYPAMLREIKRLRLTLSKNICMEILAKIDKANKDLRDFTHQNVHLESSRKQRQSQHLLDELKLIRTHALSLYRGLVVGYAWSCRCKGYHSAQMTLEKRPEGIYYEPRGNEMPQYRFRIVISTAAESGETDLVSKWQTMEFIPCLDSRKPRVGLQLDLNHRPDPSTRTVTFAAIMAQAQPTMTLFEEPLYCREWDFRPMTDICGAMRAPDTCNSSIKPMGIFVDEVDEANKLYFVLERDHEQKASLTQSWSLAKILKRSRRNPVGCRFSWASRLRFATVLAFNVLQLDGTLWFEDDWKSDDIYIHLCSEPKYRRYGDEQYFLSWKRCLGTTNAAIAKKSHGTNTRGPVTRNKSLSALGSTLVELCLDAPLTYVRLPEDNGTSDTAIRMLGIVYDEMGCAFGDIVRRCLLQPFDLRDLSLDNEDMQQKVFDLIVTPLVEILKAFDKTIGLH